MRFRNVSRIFAVCISLLGLQVAITDVHAATGAITGTVFNDKNSNGVNDGTDVGVSGVVVTAYDSSGAQVGTATSAGNGTYSLSVSSSATADVRIEFTTPNGYESSFQGAGNGTSIQFVSLPATNVNYGVIVPGEFCQNNPGTNIAGICLRPGTTSLASSKDTSSISTTNWRGTSPSLVAKNGDTGSLWGMAFDGQRQVIFASAALRRHSGLGPKGIAGLYATSRNSGGVVASWDLSQAPFNLTFSANNANFTDANRGLNNSSFLSADPIGYANVGKVGIGDIDMSPSGEWLFVSNLYQKKIHRIAVTDSNNDGVPELGAVTSFTIPANTCSNTTSRPWGLRYNPLDNTVLIGVTCSKESQTPALSTGSGTTSLPDPAVILKLTISSSTFTTVSTVDLDYVRGVEIVGGSNAGQTCKTNDPTISTPTGTACLRGRWHSWTDDFAAIESLPGAAFGMEGVFNYPTDGQSAFVQKMWWPQPIIADIEVLPSGEIVLGVMDRFGMQMGTNNQKPTYDAQNPNVNDGLVTGYVAGDTLLLCPSGGSYIQNNADGCTAATANDSYMMSRAGLGGLRDYHEIFDDNLSNGEHLELTIGGLAYNPATKELAISMMDPANQIFSGGIRYLNSDTSSSTFGQYVSGAVFNSDSNSGNNQPWTASFLKSTSMGDIELLCDRAPVQIGNRVWIDTNQNGIQDPGEPPVSGVYVGLYAATGATGFGQQLGTAMTDANGEFYFSSNLTEGWWGNGDNVGGGLVPGQSYRLRMDWAGTYTSGGALEGYELTQASALSSATALDTSVDNNATTADSFPQVTVAAVSAGANNHTYDFGFKLIAVTTTTTAAPVTTTTAAPVTTTTAAPVTTTTAAPVTTTTAAPVTTTTAAPVTTTTAAPVTTTTAAPVTTTTAAPVITTTTAPTVPTATTSIAPNRYSSASVIKVSVGDYVWLDVDRDGVQDASEKGIKNVVLSIKKVDGSPVYDVDGKLVKSTETDVNGRYSFDNLPPGQYRVFVVDPAGYAPTLTNSVADAAVDSSLGSALSDILTTDGQRDPTLDFGFYKPTSSESVEVGNYVWKDRNGNGLQGPGDTGIKGAILSLTDYDGMPVTDIFGRLVKKQTTKSDGKYLFKGLPPGRYIVRIQYPPNYFPTTPSKKDRGKNSSTIKATSLALNGGERDHTLDFGMVYRTGGTVLPLTR